MKRRDTHNCAQGKCQDLVEPQVGNEARHSGGFVRRLLERLFRIRMFPIFVIAVNREVHVEAANVVSVKARGKRAVNGHTLRLESRRDGLTQH